MKFEETDRITLCKNCASGFYDTEMFDIQRDHKSQEASSCCYCNSRMGFDYFVKEKKKPIRQRKGT